MGPTRTHGSRVGLDSYAWFIFRRSERTHNDICLSLDSNGRKEILKRYQTIDFVGSPVFIEQASAESRIKSRGLCRSWVSVREEFACLAKNEIVGI